MESAKCLLDLLVASTKQRRSQNSMPHVVGADCSSQMVSWARLAGCTPAMCAYSPIGGLLTPQRAARGRQPFPINESDKVFPQRLCHEYRYSVPDLLVL